MKDSGLVVRTAYYEALNGNVLVNSVPVPVYDDVPNDADYPYIKLSDQTSNEVVLTRSCFNVDATILIDIVTGFKQGGGKKQSDIIAGQILELVHPTITLTGDFQSVSSTLEASNTIEEKTDSHKIYRRLLRFRNFIHQIN